MVLAGQMKQSIEGKLIGDRVHIYLRVAGSSHCQCDNRAEMSAEIGLGVTTLKLNNP